MLACPTPNPFGVRKAERESMTDFHCPFIAINASPPAQAGVTGPLPRVRSQTTTVPQGSADYKSSKRPKPSVGQRTQHKGKPKGGRKKGRKDPKA